MGQVQGPLPPRPGGASRVSPLNSKLYLEQGGRTLARGCPPSRRSPLRPLLPVCSTNHPAAYSGRFEESRRLGSGAQELGLRVRASESPLGQQPGPGFPLPPQRGGEGSKGNARLYQAATEALGSQGETLPRLRE